MSGLLEAVLALVQQDALEALVRVLHRDRRVVVQPLVYPPAQLRIPRTRYLLSIVIDRPRIDCR